MLCYVVKVVTPTVETYHIDGFEEAEKLATCLDTEVNSDKHKW
jgi:hypothetical protein